MLEITEEDVFENFDGHGHIMTNKEYHSLDSIGSTSLRLLEESSLHLKNKDLFNIDSKSINIGTAVHTLTLEPEKFNEEFAIEPKNAPRNTTIGKAKWADFEENLGDKIPISSIDFENAQKMALNLRTIMRDYIEKGIVERSFFSTYRGIDMKCRPDLLFDTGNGWIIFDLKTTNDIDRLDKAIECYRYDRAMAWYRRVLTANGYNVIGTVLAFVDSVSSSHEVKLRMLQSEDLAIADDEIEDLISKHETFQKTGKVLGMIKPIEIFKWKKSQIDI